MKTPDKRYFVTAKVNGEDRSVRIGPATDNTHPATYVFDTPTGLARSYLELIEKLEQIQNAMNGG